MKRENTLSLTAGLIVIFAVLAALWYRPRSVAPAASTPTRTAAVTSRAPAQTVPVGAVDPLFDEIVRQLLDTLEESFAAAARRPHEGLLTFKDDAALQRFLERAGQSGLTVLNQSGALRTVRVRYDNYRALENELLQHARDYDSIGANYLVGIPSVPAKEDRAAVNEIPFGNAALAFLGASGDRSTWGRGVTIAVIDSGVASDATFGSGRLSLLDVGLGTQPGQGEGDGHGTSVASLAAGASADAPGLAPAANVLSIKVTDTNGLSDIFTLAQAIVAATDAGARVVNVSLGGYATNAALDRALAYATERGAVVVAAAGNDQAAQLAWPAADSRVISVGAVDRAGQQVSFSNSGAQLQLAAPGLGIQTAWLDGQRTYVDGTSASAPLVAGAIAAVLSQNSSLTPQQAAAVLTATASDAGAPGSDAAYGNGILNVGWAMNRNTPGYIDTAVSSHYYDAATDQMEFVIQNRSSQAVSGLTLNVGAGTQGTNHSIPALAAGASHVVKTPVDNTALKLNGSVAYTTQLINPLGTEDKVPANNRRSTVLSAPEQK